MDPNSAQPQQPSYVPVQVVAPAPPPRRRFRVLPFLFTGFLLLALGGSMLLNLALLGGGLASDSDTRVQERHYSHQRTASNKVAIISLEGTILSGEGFIKRQIEHARKDKNVKAVVLRVDSPGGTVSGSDLIYHQLTKLRDEKGIPVVVSMGGIAASGGYYVSMAVGSTPDTIYAEPTTWTGSVGVIIPHYNATKLMEKIGVEQDSIASHRLKGMGSFTKPMTEEEKKIFQGLVDDSFADFKKIIHAGRPKFKADPAALDKLATGQVYTADDAVKNGLVDKIGYLEDAVDQAIQLAGLSSDDVHVVQYKPEFSFMEALVGVQSRNQGLDPAALLEMSVPRAYYMCTWLPPVFSSEK